MYVSRTYNIFNSLISPFHLLLFFIIYSVIIVCLYLYLDFQWLKIPWVPISLIGTAVAFYTGFKNNSAYERTWEARKIWGGIVNSSRSWGLLVNGFVTDEYSKEGVSDVKINEIRKRLIYRHIAWLYRLKRQLRFLQSWEHNSNVHKQYRKRIEIMFPTDNPDIELKKFLTEKEVQRILNASNGCTQLLHLQTSDIRALKKCGLIDDFRHMKMQDMLTEFFTLQGKCERIKNFPLLRQYATLSIYFVYIFILLLPMGILSAFLNANLSAFIWGVVPCTTLVGWVFWMMEHAGDYAENPFENLPYDIPMTSLTRTIEIDLREMLDEVKLPYPIVPIDNFLI